MSGTELTENELLEKRIDLSRAHLPKEKRLVNIFAIVPSQHILWKGEAREIKRVSWKNRPESKLNSRRF